MKKQNLRKAAVIGAAAACAMILPVSAQEVSNDVFTVTVPDEIAEICETETEADIINFYEPLSHQDSHGGFVGSIRLYKSVRDYGYVPNYRRGGQIVLTDGTSLDVVVELPSDVQFDVQNQDSIDHYERISDALFNDIVPSITPADGVYTPQDEVDTTAVYADVLEKLRADVSGQADYDTLAEDGFSGLYSYLYDEEDPLAKTGCLYMDINFDGYDELAIGMIGGNAVYDLYTQQDGEAIHVFSGGERDVYTLVGNEYGYHTVKEEASGGAALTQISFFSLDPVSTELSSQVTFIYDGQKDPDAPWSIEYLPGEEGETVTEEEWNERIGYYGEEMQAQYTPLG